MSWQRLNPPASNFQIFYSRVKGADMQKVIEKRQWENIVPGKVLKGRVSCLLLMFFVGDTMFVNQEKFYILTSVNS